MKKRAIILVSTFILFSACMLMGCDPVYPPGKLKVSKVAPISLGDTIQIEIIYPYIGASIVVGWKDQNIVVNEEDDIVKVSGLSLKGIKLGTTTVKVNATTVLTNDALSSGYKERIYSAEVEIKVK